MYASLPEDVQQRAMDVGTQSASYGSLRIAAIQTEPLRLTSAARAFPVNLAAEHPNFRMGRDPGRAGAAGQAPTSGPIGRFEGSGRYTSKVDCIQLLGRPTLPNEAEALLVFRYTIPITD